MKKIKLINWIIILSVSIFSIFYLFFGNHEKTIYKNLIIISIIPVMLIPSLLNKFSKFKINPEIEFVYLIFIFFGHFLGSVLNFYYKIGIYDKLIHGLSGVMTSILAVVILVKSKCYENNPIWVNILFIISVTLSVAAFWEFFEFINDNIFSKDAQKVIKTGVDDTMTDMIMAFIGSIIYSVMYFIETKTKKKMVVGKFADNIK
ncbi:MAG: DUF2238 domain-containing protein [Firmicutes bacterium]|nr:DUF2238 domain-containing protein [Bacillota bacterium]